MGFNSAFKGLIGTGVISRGYSGRGMKLISYHLVSRLITTAPIFLCVQVQLYLRSVQSNGLHYSSTRVPCDTAPEDPSFLGCYTVTTGKLRPTIRRRVVPHVQGQAIHERTWDCSILKKEAVERSNIQQHRWEKLRTHDVAFICNTDRQPRPRALWCQRKLWCPLRIQILTLQFCAHILTSYGNFSSMNRILIQYQGDVQL